MDLDQYPQVEPICLPELYYRSKDYYKEYYSGYGRIMEAPGNARQIINLEGSADDLECWVVGYQYSPQEEIKVNFVFNISSVSVNMILCRLIIIWNQVFSLISNN